MVRLDIELIAAANALAKKKGISLDALTEESLWKLMRRGNYDQAKIRAVARLEQGMNLGWKRPRSRDETHERRSSQYGWKPSDLVLSCQFLSLHLSSFWVI